MAAQEHAVSQQGPWVLNEQAIMKPPLSLYVDDQSAKAQS